VTHVALTHHHTDHALGAGWFAGAGAVVVAQRLCAEAMAAQHAVVVEQRRATPALAALFADATVYQPGLVFEERHLLDLGDLPVELRWLGPGHTSGDAVVLIEPERALVCGDLVSVGYHFNYEEASVEHLQATLDRLSALPARLLIPGHGPPGGPEIIAAQAAYHRELSTAIHGGATRDDLRERFPGYLLESALDVALEVWGRARGEASS
jgi:cyclase